MRYKLPLAYFPNEETETQRSYLLEVTPPEPGLEMFALITPLSIPAESWSGSVRKSWQLSIF